MALRTLKTIDSESGYFVDEYGALPPFRVKSRASSVPWNTQGRKEWAVEDLNL